MTIEILNKKNNVKVYSVYDNFFKPYGRIIENYDFSTLINYMKKYTNIPEQGNIYLASVEDMEKMNICETIKNTIYGGMPIQIGYCNGKNSTYNGFEYHKSSEINIAVTDFMLVLGYIGEIEDNTYNIKNAKVFFVEKGTAIEMYQTTLHLSPCRVTDEGFKNIIILPKGTNTPIEYTKQIYNNEDKLLLQKNKWVIAHKDREPLIKQGAFVGVIGENKELYY